MGVFDNIFGGQRSAQTAAPTSVSREPKYVELDWKSQAAAGQLSVRVLTLSDYADVESVLEYLRDQNNIIVLKIKPRLVQEKMELKRALKRIQRTTQATGGDIAGIKEDVILVTPQAVNIARATEQLVAQDGYNSDADVAASI